MSHQSHYEINISRNGQHVFATHERSLYRKHQANMVFNLLRKKFPKQEGYEVTIIYWEIIGQGLTATPFLDEY